MLLLWAGGPGRARCAVSEDTPEEREVRRWSSVAIDCWLCGRYDGTFDAPRGRRKRYLCHTASLIQDTSPVELYGLQR
jgi:hypothetical protein